MLLRQEMPCALVLALDKAGNNNPARMAMMAMTTSNSIRVNPRSALNVLIVSLRLVLIVSFWIITRPLGGPHAQYRLKAQFHANSQTRSKADAAGKTPSDLPD